jgi:pimeloyl-ACP methyl ester carboxylesterase
MDSPTLLLLPGLLCDAASWAAQCESMSGQARCIVADYGTADSIDEMARRVLEAAPPGPFAMAGHSMGARVALALTRLAPRRITHLALFDTGLDPIAAGEDGERERRLRYALLTLARDQGMRAMGRQWAQGMVLPAHRTAPVFERILAMIERKSPDVFEAQIAALLGRPDERATFAALDCPVLIGCGRHDAWSPLARHEQMQRMKPTARLAVIENAGHMSPMEQPDAVSRVMVQWLQCAH